MQVRRSLIYFAFIIFFLLKCADSKKSSSDSVFSNKIKLVEKWTEVEMLSQKYTAERKFNSAIPCISFRDSLSIQQKDSLLLYWSNYPEELKNIVDDLLSKNGGKK
jgi:putative IMPACT (imprinted ancient) family translation regulator